MCHVSVAVLKSRTQGEGAETVRNGKVKHSFESDDAVLFAEYENKLQKRGEYI